MTTQSEQAVEALVEATPDDGNEPLFSQDVAEVPEDDRPLSALAVEAPAAAPIEEETGERPDETSQVSGDPFVEEKVPEAPPIPLSVQAQLDRLAEFESRQQELDRREAVIQQNDRDAQVQKAYEDQGRDPESARELAEAYRAGRQSNQKEQEAFLARQQFEAAKAEAVKQYSSKYGVDPNYLRQFNDQTSMEAAAVERAARIKDKVNFDNRLKAVEENRVDEGTYDSGSSSSASLDGAALEEAAGRGKVMSADEMRKLGEYQKSQMAGG